MSQSTPFIPEQSNTNIASTVVFETNMTTGKVTQITQYVPVTTAPDGSLSFGAATYRTADNRADYVVSGVVSDRPKRVQLPSERLQITGVDGIALAAVPTHAAYAEITVEDHAIRWTIDGSGPSDNNGKRSQDGARIVLQSRDEILGFRAIPLLSEHRHNKAMPKAHLTIYYHNISPESDRF